jgi:hypothetical protein
MNPIQSQPAPETKNSLQAAFERWWKTIQVQTEQFQQTVSKRDTGKIYREAFQRSWQLLKQSLTLISLIFLSIAGIFIGLWLIGFNAGRKLRDWLEIEEPTPSKIWLKVTDILLFPFRWTIILLDKALNKAFGWDFKLTEMLPPEYSQEKLAEGQSKS